ncbi:MAG: hypothetical protein Q7S22_03015 [Candidatus Micrarchaeota archaeon]|nr:hypothetical protein [Candidatus Micrarchaeota archaeon]
MDFRLDELISNYFAKNAKQGYWLEWYIGRFLKSMNIAPIMNKKFKHNGQEVEIDLMYKVNNRQIYVTCDTSKDSVFDVENFHLIPEIIGAKDIVLITTNKKIAPKVISAARKHFERVTAIYFNDLASLRDKMPIN